MIIIIKTLNIARDNEHTIKFGFKKNYSYNILTSSLSFITYIYYVQRVDIKFLFKNSS